MEMVARMIGRTWRKLVFDFQQCIINTNGFPQFVIRLRWLQRHLQKCLIKMIECQIMSWLFDNEAQNILWRHLFGFERITIDATNREMWNKQHYVQRFRWDLNFWGWNKEAFKCNIFKVLLFYECHFIHFSEVFESFIQLLYHLYSDSFSFPFSEETNSKLFHFGRLQELWVQSATLQFSI